MGQWCILSLDKALTSWLLTFAIHLNSFYRFLAPSHILILWWCDWITGIWWWFVTLCCCCASPPQILERGRVLSLTTCQLLALVFNPLCLLSNMVTSRRVKNQYNNWGVRPRQQTRLIVRSKILPDPGGPLTNDSRGIKGQHSYRMCSAVHARHMCYNLSKRNKSSCMRGIRRISH